MQRYALATALLAALAGALLLTGLDCPYLWQDEAQTALLARSVLREGLPLGSDGLNSFSQELGAEFGADRVWKWHTWLSFYLVAGSFALLGENTLAARLPFALCGVAAVLLTALTARSLWRDPRAGLFAGFTLSLSVPFLVLSRQARWYTLAALLSLLGIHAYSRLESEPRRASWLLFAAAVLLFHTHFLYCATLLLTLLLHSLWLEPARRRTILLVSAATTAVCLPWVLWFSSTRPGGGYLQRLLQLGDTAASANAYVRLLLDYFPGWPLLVACLALLVLRRAIGRESPLTLTPDTRSGVLLILIFCGVNVLALSLLAPDVYFRYLTPLAPPLFVLGGLLLARVWPWAAAALLVVWLATGTLRDFVYELSHDFDGPIEGIVRFLQQKARPGDTVAMVYGDMPVKFYTGLRVVGGLTGEDLAAARNADWIILRHHTVAPVNREVRKALMAQLSPRRYVRYELDYPETAFENREDPRVHRFRSAPLARRVVVYGRKR